MYTRMLHFVTDLSHKEEVLKTMDMMMPRIKGMEGCQGCRFIMHDADGNYALLVDWDSKDHAEAAAQVIGKQLLPVIGKIATGPVVPRLYENYVPAAH